MPPMNLGRRCPRNHPDRIRVSFDDTTGSGGQCRAAPSGHPAHHEWACGNSSTITSTWANTQDADAGHCIDDADASARILGGTIKAPSTLGTFLRTRPSTGPGEPGVAGTRLAGRRRTRRSPLPCLDRETYATLYRQAGLIRLAVAAGC